MIEQTVKQEAIHHNDENSSVEGFENRREYVRVFYPTHCQAKFLPEMIVNHRSCIVLDISERGIRFAISNSAFIKNKIVTALVRFPDGFEIEISGEVIRRNYNQVALKLDRGIPYSRIMSEQLRLRNLEANGVISLPYATRR